jgi:hypothetical protein
VATGSSEDQVATDSPECAVDPEAT